LIAHWKFIKNKIGSPVEPFSNCNGKTNPICSNIYFLSIFNLKETVFLNTIKATSLNFEFLVTCHFFYFEKISVELATFT